MKTIFLFFSFFLFQHYLSAQNFEWVKQVGDAGGEQGNAITTDNKGNVYHTGFFQGTVDFDPNGGTLHLTSSGSYDIYVQKLTPTGDLVWAKTIGGLGFDNGTAIAIDPTGAVLITGFFRQTVDFDPGVGTFNLTANGQDDIFILKLDVNGNFLWAKSMGGSDRDQGIGIGTDNNGDIYCTGFFKNSVDFDPSSNTTPLSSYGDADIFIQKLDATGNFLWAKNIGGSMFDIAKGLIIDDNNHLYLTGSFSNTVDFDPSSTTLALTSQGDQDIFIQKLDHLGNLIWVKQIGGIEEDQGNAITIDQQQNVYITGYFGDQVDFDPGSGVFTKTTTANANIFALKLNNNGAFVWVATMDSNIDYNYSHAIAVDSSQQVYLTGVFKGATDFDPGPGVLYMSSGGFYHFFIQKLTNTGQLAWAHGFGDTGAGRGQGIHIYNNNYLYTTGFFALQIDFDPSMDTFLVTAPSADNIFIHKMGINSNDVAIPYLAPPSNIKISPNPSTERVLVEWEHPQETAITLLDVQGKIVLPTQKTAHNNIQLSIAHLPSGLYYISILTPRSQTITKLIKQ